MIMAKKRYELIDTLRGIALINMILYHGIWDLVHIYGVDWAWYTSAAGYWWQQGICYAFILLSGFCWPLGRKHFQRGLIVFAAGAFITAVTSLFAPDARVLFGVLTLIGSSMLLTTALQKWLSRIRPLPGLLGSAFFFILTRNINGGYLGFEWWNFVKLPEFLYANNVTAYLGFPRDDFVSADYFGLLPWFFLYLVGYFLFRVLEERKQLDCLQKSPSRAVKFVGKRSLVIYLLHQPILYAAFSVLFAR